MKLGNERKAYKRYKRGEITLNEYRKEIGYPPIPELQKTVVQTNGDNISSEVSKFIATTFVEENPDPTDYSTAVKLLFLQMEEGYNLETARLELLKLLKKKNRTIQETASMPCLYELVRRYT